MTGLVPTPESGIVTRVRTGAHGAGHRRRRRRNIWQIRAFCWKRAAPSSAMQAGAA